MLSRRSRWCIIVIVSLTAACGRADGGSGSPRASSCELAADTAALGRVARDTIGHLRARPQRTSRVLESGTGTTVRTENVDSAALHDGGLVSFDCTGRITLVWLDGG